MDPVDAMGIVPLAALEGNATVGISPHGGE